MAINSHGHFNAVAPVSPRLEPHHKTHQVAGIAQHFSRGGTNEQEKGWVML